MGKGICRGCGAPILWIRTESGKSMPCGPDPVTYWQNAVGCHKIVTPNGEVLSVSLEGDPQQATGIGFISHFATCPNRDDFRKGR